MRFREEILAKIFTYVTVIVLLGLAAFEAYLLQTERTVRKEAQERNSVLQEDLDWARKLNYELETANEEMRPFYEEWSAYAAFSSSAEALSCKKELFSRSFLIPQEAIERWKRNVSGGAEDGEEGETTAWEEEVSFSFGSPDGEDVFAALRSRDEQACIVYTLAYPNKETGRSGGPIELIFELQFADSRLTPARDENGELCWYCIAYNSGDGWIRGE